uniref:RNA helicase n=3 Tax=Rhodnius prolixus TaxID=13249 RepID=A0A905QWL2_RHOPR
MSDDYGGNRFGRGGGRGRGNRGGSFSGGRGRGRNDHESAETPSNFYNSAKYENNDDDWEENPRDSDRVKSSTFRSGGKGYGGYGRQDRNVTFDNDDDQDNQSDDGNRQRGGGGRGSVSHDRRNFGNDWDSGSKSYSRGVDRFGGGDGGDYRKARNEDSQRGRGRGRWGGKNDNNDSGNYYSRKRNEDNSPSRSDDGDRRRGGQRGEGTAEEKDEKKKERYIPPDPTDDEEVMFGTGITSGINFSKYDNIRVKVSGENSVPPINKFEEAGLRDLVYKNVKKSGYITPTPIQKYALPTIMMGRDLMACAQTGSGKTAAFLIPIIHTLLESPSELIITSTSVEPQAVIMSPTRELTIQIFNEARKFAHGSIIKVAMAYGGTASFHQASVLMRGCHILVATPGRLNDFVSRDKVKFSSVRYFVLDEADRMLDMGFKPEIEKMLLHESMVPV